MGWGSRPKDIASFGRKREPCYGFDENARAGGQESEDFE